MSASARPKRGKALATVFVGGFVIGTVAAAFSRPTEIFLTDTISYDPSAHWWLHGLVYGSTLTLLAGAMWGTARLCGVLFVRGLLFLVGGGLILGLASLMLYVGFAVDSLDDGQRVLFRWVLGPTFALLGGVMLWSGWRFRTIVAEEDRDRSPARGG